MKNTRIFSFLYLIYLLCWFGSRISADNPRYERLLLLQPQKSDSVQLNTVVGLLERLLPNHFQWFNLVVDRNFIISSHSTDQQKYLDRFRIENVKNGESIIQITGNTGVAVANGLYFYLKYVANCSISWSGNQLDNLPSNHIPSVSEPIEMILREKFRYYQNTCTASYSFVWWQWPRWEKEIDWMALHGINLPLAFNGQEVVYRNTFKRFNLTIQEIDDYFTGPAYLAWNRMGNLQTWYGPLTEHWHQHQMVLQKKILDRMRRFGMYPVVPGFTGHVPKGLKQYMKGAIITQSDDWNDFGENYSRTYFLEPEDQNFMKIGKLFIQEYVKLYGTDHFYNIDLFNEENPSSSDAAYLRKCGKNVYESIKAGDPSGTWVMQGWLFHYARNFWNPKQVEAFVTSVPMDRIIILDLASETQPVYNRLNGYFDRPFLWCMLHNFGGTHGMYGALNRINSNFFPSRKSYPNLLGIGLTMEGIEQNDLVYDYMTEVTWYDSDEGDDGIPDMSQWFDRYVERRYGFVNNSYQHSELLMEAWQLLRESVYTDPKGIDNHGQYIIIKKPQPSMSPFRWYNPRNVSSALKLFNKFLDSNSKDKKILNSETFVYDIVDLSRQTLQLIFDFYYNNLENCRKKNNLAEAEQTMANMTKVLEMMEDILQCSQHWLLYPWIHSARLLGNDTKEQDFNEHQARTQISIWGDSSTNFNHHLIDYAAKQWSGMFRYYYSPRWQFYFKYLREILSKNQTGDWKKFERDLFDKIEVSFTRAFAQPMIEKAITKNLIETVGRIVEEVTHTLDLVEDDDGDGPIPYGFYEIQSNNYALLKSLTSKNKP